MKPPKLVGYEFDKSEIEGAVKNKKLLALLLAYNTKCNLHCPFCFTQSGKKAICELKKQKISTDLLNFEGLKRIIDNGIELGIKSVVFWGEGEPLLDKELFFSLVKYANKKKLTPVLFTNGTKIDKKTAKLLFENNVSVVGKLHSLNPKINKYLTGDRNDLYKYIEFDSILAPSYIKYLLDAGYKNTNRFALQTVVTSKNYDEIAELWKWNRERGIIPYTDFLYLPSDLDVSKEKRIELQKKIWKLDKELGYNYDFFIGPHLGPKGACDNRANLYIGAHGIARLCGATYVFLGNARKESLKDILSKKIEADKKFCRYLGKECAYCDCYLQNLKLPKK